MNYITELFNSRPNSILDLYLKNPSAKHNQKQIIKITRLSKATAVKWFSYLVKKKLLLLERIGPTNLYTMNNEDILVKELKRLHILALLKEVPLTIETYLYGSCARGDYDEHSDIDLLIISDIKRDQIIGDIESFSEKIAKPINFKIFKEYEWQMMKEKDKPFYERVEKDKLRII
jgi:predicted nucleotidyltransferase